MMKCRLNKYGRWNVFTLIAIAIPASLTGLPQPLPRMNPESVTGLFTREKFSGGKISITVPPGDCRILEVKCRDTVFQRTNE